MTEPYLRPGKILTRLQSALSGRLETGGRVSCPQKGTRGLARLVLPAAGGNLCHRGQGKDSPVSEPSPTPWRSGALVARRVTQGIYRFDPTTFDALWKTPVAGDIPTEVLFHLPEWCVYIPTPDQTWQGANLNGFFAHLESDMNDRRTELRLVLM